MGIASVCLAACKTLFVQAVCLVDPGDVGIEEGWRWHVRHFIQRMSDMPDLIQTKNILGH